VKWFIADLHLDHQFVLGLRQKFLGLDCFQSLPVWQEYIIDKTLSITNKGDDIFHLGDFAFSKQHMHRLKSRLKGRNNFLVVGNHDPNFTACKEIFGNGQVRTLVHTNVCKHTTVLCHYPMAYWHKSHYGSFHLYGHVHDMRTKTLDIAFPGRRSLDVGPESLYNVLGEIRPINEQEVYDILIARPGHDPIDFYKNEEWRNESD
jgi:calcineurin-like phosphoesterase family protein